jgi:transcriptional regulator NrdR family protein
MSNRRKVDMKKFSRGGTPGCRMCGCMMTEVADSRPTGFASAKRQRQCRNCKEPVTTYEVPVPEGFKVKVVPEDEEEEVAA